jgi:hypothetical protein
MDDLNIDEMKDVYGDLNDFDQRMKGKQSMQLPQGDDSSSDEGMEPAALVKRRQDPMWQLEEKNRVLLDRLYKSEKLCNDFKDTIDALSNTSESQKDKRIVELVKKNKALNLQAEGLKNKAAKAAEFALEMKKENDASMKKAPILKTQEPTANSSTMSGGEAERKLKELEKRVTKMRNENQEQKQLIDKATRLLEREIGEVVDIAELYKEESQWKGRS